MKTEFRIMRARSGSGLMSYIYRFVQIGGYEGQSNDPVIGSEILESFEDAKTKGEGVVVDCRWGKCKRISWEEFKKIWDEQ